MQNNGTAKNSKNNGDGDMAPWIPDMPSGTRPILLRAHSHCPVLQLISITSLHLPIMSMIQPRYGSTPPSTPPLRQCCHQLHHRQGPWITPPFPRTWLKFLATCICQWPCPTCTRFQWPHHWHQQHIIRCPPPNPNRPKSNLWQKSCHLPTQKIRG